MNQPSSPKHVLFLHPMTPEFEGISQLVHAAILKVPAVPVQVGPFPSGGSATSQVQSAIREADIVLADIAGGNANVLFEIGIATAIGKPLILLAQRSRSVPFDLAHHRIVYYSDRTKISELLVDISDVIRRALENPVGFESAVQARAAAAKVFVSYSHKDAEFLDRLLVHLRPLERDGRLILFADTKIRAGDKWREEIQQALTTASVAILLVSADFLASEFVVNNELPPLLERAEREGTKILPVIVKPCRFTRDPHLQEFQAINDPRNALINLTEGRQEEIYDDVARIVEELVPMVSVKTKQTAATSRPR